ncbi:MAG TPA: hypothetical protein VLL73_04940 [Desulfurivibrionaceae bacterium]|nr:hypothetical protein [Desulfurivibrionaceae bacterium]
MPETTLPPFVRHLLKPESYPHPAAEIKLVQTHISYVFLAGDFVYKFKKPVNFGFLDFTTLEKRKHFCEQELVLNRRLCPDLYLGIVPVNEQGGALSLSGPGEPVEYGVKMARMPEAGMMANFIASGKLDRAMIDRIVAMLVPFYQQADGGPEIQKFGTAQAVSVNVLENFEQTQGFIGCPSLSQQQFDTISSYAKGVLAQEARFNERIAAGRIRDCHGDLYSANICFDEEKVHIFDCIEFNQRFRYCDVASDVAFLAMDLDFHGMTDLSRSFIDSFVAQSGDAGLVGMLNFYKCYRAYVRGKINLFTAHAPEVDAATKAKCFEMAGKYFTLAERYATTR